MSLSRKMHLFCIVLAIRGNRKYTYTYTDYEYFIALHCGGKELR